MSTDSMCCCYPGCTEPAAPKSRGNCKPHYHQFKYARGLRKTAAAKRAFDARQVAQGKVLASARGRCRKQTNPYLQGSI